MSKQETNLWGPTVPTESYRSSERDASNSDSYSNGSDSEFEDLYDSEYDVYDEYLHETIVEADNNGKWVESDKGERFDKPKRKGVQIETETIQEHECGVGGEDCESDELRSLSGSSSDNDETKHQRKKHPQFNAKSDMVDPHFKLGMLFKNSIEFRAAVRQHAIKWGKKIRFSKNERYRIRAICRAGCDWMIYASKLDLEKTMQVKTYNGSHSCTRTFKVKHASSDWVADTYSDRLRSNPTWPMKSLKETIEKEHVIKLDRFLVYRGKEKAMTRVNGTDKEQFSLL